MKLSEHHLYSYVLKGRHHTRFHGNVDNAILWFYFIFLTLNEIMLLKLCNEIPMIIFNY